MSNTSEQFNLPPKLYAYLDAGSSKKIQQLPLRQYPPEVARPKNTWPEIQAAKDTEPVVVYQTLSPDVFESLLTEGRILMNTFQIVEINREGQLWVRFNVKRSKETFLKSNRTTAVNNRGDSNGEKIEPRSTTYYVKGEDAKEIANICVNNGYEINQEALVLHIKLMPSPDSET